MLQLYLCDSWAVLKFVPGVSIIMLWLKLCMNHCFYRADKITVCIFYYDNAKVLQCQKSCYSPCELSFRSTITDPSMTYSAFK